MITDIHLLEIQQSKLNRYHGFDLAVSQVAM